MLKRDFIQFNDYMLTLNVLQNNLEKLSLSNLVYWQKELPFNIDFIRRIKFRAEKMESVISLKYQKSMVSVLKGTIAAYTDQVSHF